MAETFKSGDVEINFFVEEVILLVEKVVADGLANVALEIQGQAVLNIRSNNQIDTGFMMNSGYVVAKNGTDTYSKLQSSGVYSGKSGDNLRRELADRADLPEGVEALVAFGANYAIYQEAAKPFLFKAATEIAGKVDGKFEVL